MSNRKSIGKYVDLKQLANGGMAEVYIGTDPNLNRKVAIKLILPHLADKSDFEARFQKEAKAIAGMRHSNIIQIFEYSIDDGTPFMVMEYLSGGTLDDVLKRYRAEGRPMPLEKAANILNKIAKGLDYAHQRGLIHRDIKPSNILFSEDEEPIIADFGIVKLLGDSTGLTQTGGLVGSPKFLSPEQASQKSIDHRSDIYSLGIVLYQMVTGEAPFKGDMVNVIMQHINHRPENPTHFNSALSSLAADVIMKALEKQPENRYESAGEMAQVFAKHLADSKEIQPTLAEKIEKTEILQTEAKPHAQTVVESGIPAFPSSADQDQFQTQEENPSPKLINFNVLIGILGLIVLAVVIFMFLSGRLTSPENSTANSPVNNEAVSASQSLVAGTITYVQDGRVYSLAAQEGGIPIDISEALDQLSPNGSDSHLNISPNGEWLVLETERFDLECADWACLAVIAADVSSGDVIRSNGQVIRSSSSMSAIASSGDLVIYDSNNGPHELDLWAISRSSDKDNWEAPILLTADSENEFNYLPAISDDGSKLVFNCGPQAYSDEGASICQVNTDGSGLHLVLTPADAPAGLPTTGALHQPDYAPNGDIIFEASWNGEQIWRLPFNATKPFPVGSSFNNDNSPCVLPDGRIASLWLGRQGNNGIHELKIMEADGESYFVVIPNLDIADIGIGCGS